MPVKLNDSKWRKIVRKISNMPHVKVGVLQSAGKTDDGEFDLVALAATHEFGSPAAGIPERSFIRAGLRGNTTVAKTTAKLARSVVTGKTEPDKALALLGQVAVAEIKKFVTAGPDVPPPLKQATIDRKKSSRPLVDTGRLINSVNYEVVVK